MTSAQEMVAPMGQELPPDGIDLRAELVAHQRWRVEQAINRAGNLAGAARLLRVSQLELLRMQRGGLLPIVPPTPNRRVPTGESELTRIEAGVEIVSRATIRRLHGEGYSPRQIATRLGLRSPYFVEKVLRAEAELAKCGPVPKPERSA